jgi:heat shock transcription factor 1
MRTYRNLPQHLRTSQVGDPEDWIDTDFLQSDSAHDKDYDYSPKEEPARKKRKYRKRKNMHPLESGGVGVPAFLAKLWRLVEDPETNNLISWSQVSFNLLIY